MLIIQAEIAIILFSGKLQLSVRHKILVKMFTKIIKKYAEKALNNNKHILKCLLRLILSLEIMI